MPLFHNRQPQGNAYDPPPSKKSRDDRKTAKADRTESRRLDRADDRKARDWVKKVERERRKER